MMKLILTKPEKISKVFLDNIKKSGKNVLCILSTKTYAVFNKDLKKSCSGKNCFVIDTLAEVNNDNAVYIPSSNLTALSIAINQAQQPFDGKVTIVLDSVSGLAIRNETDVLMKFFLFIIKKSHDWGADLILTLPEDGTNQNLLGLLKQSADKVEKK